MRPLFSVPKLVVLVCFLDFFVLAFDKAAPSSLFFFNMCIAIRNIVVREGVGHIQAGAGIVADSDPEAEYQETLNKAGGMLRAIRAAGGRA